MKLKKINDYHLKVIDYLDSDAHGSFQEYAFYTNDGKYIGDFDMASNLIINHKINHFECLPNASVCTIGLSDISQKWYGWSHRGIWGFGIGSEVKKGDVAYTEERGEWIAKTLADARQMAIDYARGIN